MSSQIQKIGACSSTSTANSNSSSNVGKQRRRARSSCPRKVNLVNIDVAEARRQVYHALLLHRKSSFPFSSSSSSSSTSSSRNVALNVATYSTQLAQSMPQPEPVWSTTGPTVVLPHVTQMSYYGEAADVEFVWGDQNQASAYAWWLTFLKNLDGNKGTSEASVDEESKCPLALGSSNWFGNVKAEEVDDRS